MKTGTQAELGFNVGSIYEGIPLYQTRLVRDGAYALPTLRERPQFREPADVGSFLVPYFEVRDREEFIVVFLDTANCVTGMHVVSVGGLAASIVEPRQVFKAAILANAAAIIIAHNHPSGNPEPSREDLKITKQLLDAGTIMGIPIHDHVIIAGDFVTSFADRGLMM